MKFSFVLITGMLILALIAYFDMLLRIEPELTSHYCRINSHVIAGMAL